MLKSIIISLIMALNIQVFAGRMGGVEERAFGQFFNEAMLDQIGISRDNQSKIRKIVINLRSSIMDIHFKMKKKRKILIKKMNEEKYNEKEIITLITDIAELKKQQHLTVELQKFQIMKLLTKNQRSELYKMITFQRRAFWQRHKSYRPGQDPRMRANQPKMRGRIQFKAWYYQGKPKK